MVCNQSPGMIDWLLELGAARVARPVLRGGGGSDATSLPNHIGILQQKGATRTALLAAAVALLALTSLPMADKIGALTVGTVQHLDDHCASPSCGCFGASHLGNRS